MGGGVEACLPGGRDGDGRHGLLVADDLVAGHPHVVGGGLQATSTSLSLRAVAANPDGVEGGEVSGGVAQAGGEGGERLPAASRARTV